MSREQICLVALTATLIGLLSAAPSLTHAQEQKAPEPKDKRMASSQWGGNYFPNVELTSSKGEKVRFFDDLVEGKVVMINFIYTRCPDACPLETARLSEVYQILGDRVGQDVFMYSITIDPGYDTPEVLTEFMQTYQIEDGWEFFTGKEEEILLLRKKLGLYIDEVNKDPLDHNLSMIVGNQKTGRWMKKSPFENPYILATEIGTWLHNYKNPMRRTNMYQDAPELRKLSQGESLFRTRCAACHEIGRTPGSVIKPGPNLMDVTVRREHDWLVRWIKEPDVMLEEKDPIATELFEAYNKLPMPNLRINDHEVDMLLDFIETESRRMKKVMEVEAIAAQQEVEEMDCCQKFEEMVLESDTTDSQTVEEESLVSTEQDSELVANSSEESVVQVSDTVANEVAQVSQAEQPTPKTPRPLSLISWACGLGLSILAFRARMVPRN